MIIELGRLKSGLPEHLDLQITDSHQLCHCQIVTIGQNECHAPKKGTPYLYYLWSIKNIRDHLLWRCYDIVACNLPRAPSYSGVRTWVEGSQMLGDRALARASNLLGYKH